MYESQSSRHKTVNSHSNTPSEIKIDDKKNQTEINIESPQVQPYVESNTNSTEKTQQYTKQIPETSYSEKFTRQTQNPPLVSPLQFSEVLSYEQSKRKN